MRYILAVFVAALILATPAYGQARDDDSQARAGVEKAKAAGITIDSPATEDAMARAPIGSCPNDPTQAECPKVHKIADGVKAGVWAPDVVAKGAKAFARLAQLPGFCQMYWNSDNPYKAAGYAQMNVSAWCPREVSALELYGWLFKRYNGVWYQMNGLGTRVPGGETARIHTTWNCDGSPYRYWRANGEAWALLNGGWYYKERIGYNYLYCG